MFINIYIYIYVCVIYICRYSSIWIKITAKLPPEKGDPGLKFKGFLPAFFFCPVTKSCPSLYNPMDRGTPGFPVLHCLMEVAQILSIESVMSSNHLIICCPLLLPSISFAASGSFPICQAYRGFFFLFFWENAPRYFSFLKSVK